MVVGDLTTAIDVLIIGAGPGGYVAALRAAQLGKQVTLVEATAIGGVCLNEGCIPSKAILSAADQFHRLASLTQLGICAREISLDYPRMQSWKDDLVTRLRQGIEQLLKTRQIQIIRGRAWFIGPQEVRIEHPDSTHRLSFEQCIIATGATPMPLPGLAFDDRQIITPGQALQLKRLPAAITIVGSNGIAAELATLFAKLDVDTCIALPDGHTLLADFELSATRLVQSNLEKLGVIIKHGSIDTVMPDRTYVVVGELAPYTGALDLQEAGITTDTQDFILVNQQMQTQNTRVYAVGDCTAGQPLATVAIKQAKVAAEHIAGQASAYQPQTIPMMVWTDPQIARVGLSSEEALAAGYDIVTGRFPLAASGRALMLNSSTPSGYAEIIAERGNDLILGVSLVGVGAETVIGEAALAIEMGATLVDIAETLHPHPGLSEPLQEAAEAALGLPIHSLPKR